MVLKVQGWRWERGSFWLPLFSLLFWLLAFPPFRWVPFLFVAWVPLFLWAPTVTARRRFLGFFLVAAGFYLVHLRWILHMQVEPGVERYLVAGWLLLVAGMALLWGLLGLAWGIRKRRYRLLFGPVLWLLLEYFRGWWLFQGFPWATPALPLVAVPGLRLGFALVGMYGLGYLVILFNALVAEYHERGFAGGLLGLILLAAIGLLAEHRMPLPDTGPRILILQPGELAPGWDYEEDWRITRRSYGAVLQALQKDSVRADLVVLSESAFPGYFLWSDRAKNLAREILRATHARALLLGTTHVQRRHGHRYPTNTAMLVDSLLRVQGMYHKVHLVPFGEWLPYEDRWAWLERLDFGQGDYRPGDSLVPLTWDSLRLGVLICFESMFPAVARGLVRRGARILVNISNDGWFGRSLGPVEHFEYARMRALETHRFVVRAAKVGISAFIDPLGRVRQRLDFGEAGYLVARVPPLSGKTPYAAWGEGGVFALVLLAAFIILATPTRRKGAFHENL